MKLRLYIFCIFCLLSLNAFAADIAQCSNPSGKSYYPYHGLISKDNSGWTDDGIKGGLTKVTVDGNGKYDIIFVDTTKNIISSRADGGEVLLYSRGSNSFGIVVIYPQKTIETYNFIKNNAGALEYFQTTSMAGDEVSIIKGSLFRGSCSYINFNLLK